MHIQITELFYLAYTALISEGPNESLAWFVTCENIKEIAPWLWKLILRVCSWGPADAGTTSSSPAPRYLEDFAETLSLPSCPCLIPGGTRWHSECPKCVSRYRCLPDQSQRPCALTPDWNHCDSWSHLQSKEQGTGLFSFPEEMEQTQSRCSHCTASPSHTHSQNSGHVVVLLWRWASCH